MSITTVSSEESLDVLHNAYEKRHGGITDAEREGITAAWRAVRAAEEAERETMLPYIAISVACFGGATDWPDPYRAAAVAQYGLKSSTKGFHD